jgi:hypothetical protein
MIDISIILDSNSKTTIIIKNPLFQTSNYYLEILLLA